MTQRTRRGLASWMTTSHTPFFVLDQRRVVLVFNRGCEELTQWSAGELIGKTCDFLSSPVPDQVECLTSALCPPHIVFLGESVSTVAVLRKKNGEVLKRTIHFHPLTHDDYEDGKVRVLGVFAPFMENESTSQDRHFDLSRVTAKLHQRYSIDRLIATLPATKKLAAQTVIARKGTESLWIKGEPGVGKEHLARLIHYGSPAKLARFIPVRCGQSSHFEIQRLLDQLKKADDTTATVYLENVERIPRDLQSDLLELMQLRKKLRWFGSSPSDPSSLSDATFSTRLREQLSTQLLFLPPLRERTEELLLLVQQLLEECNRDQEKQVEKISAEVERLFLQYNWPGNTEELSRVIQASWHACAKSSIEVENLPVDFRIGLDSQKIGPPVKRLPLEEQLLLIEREEICRALQEAQGNKSIAAKLLGLPRAKLYRRLEALNIETEMDAEQ